MTPDDSARNRKMMSLNSSICLMPIFGVGKVYGIWTPKGGPPQYKLLLVTTLWYKDRDLIWTDGKMFLSNKNIVGNKEF